MSEKANLISAGLAAVVIGASLASSSAPAQQPEECFSKYTRVNVCEHARRFQQAVAPNLPMRISAEVTIVSVMAAGPMISMNAQWSMDARALDQALIASNVTKDELRRKMDLYAKNFVCSDNILAAFVRLGGKIAHTYATTDKHNIHNTLVETCPELGDYWRLARMRSAVVAMLFRRARPSLSCPARSRANASARWSSAALA